MMSLPEHVTRSPNNQDIENLNRIAQDILDPEKTIVDLIPHIGDLRALLERHTLLKLTTEVNLAEDRTMLDSGMAVSPLMAAFCAREVLRSAAFIKGAGAAVQDAAREDRPVRVLYAGCGPFALLALPLMAVFSAQQVVFTLIDIHPESLRCAQHLIDAFGFSSHVLEHVCADATRYQIPPDSIPDVIVSETMNVCLGKEPQVSIARHLLAQAPDALMVPQAVSVEACLLDRSKEHVPVAEQQDKLVEPVRDRIYLGKIFELNAENIRQWADITEERLPAGSITIPTPLLQRYQLRLLTRIVVYGQACLQDYDSSLNLPQALPGKPTFAGGETLQFHYQLGVRPGLCYETIG
ncbi:hypothetical protein B0F87_10285 [Methylobacter tundripaludum]|uniref:Uncharacterized protein n=1 Tax=Methylobacter tundripaludum TaxID=173365 RepID=A0A2S6HHP2_9GAMM|nr:hypothetical protein [Methylobacter tundripaludum]PPK76980.1 hypothetical protein B0F87_10285 [Methylobacter tundripaludum]